MKSNSTLLFIVFTTLLYGQDIWIQRDSLNGPTRANSASFVLEDDGYVVSGYDGFSKKRSMVSYDIDQDDWDNELSLGGVSGDGLNRSSSVGFAVGGFGFIGLGEANGFMFTDLWKFDRYSNTWTQMADYAGGARTQAVSFVVDDTAYVGTGKDSDFSTFLKDFYSYDYVTNSWAQISNFPGTARLDAIGIKMGGKGYVGLGYDGSSYPIDFYEYAPVTNSWTQKASFPGTPRINATGFAVFPQLFVTTGDDGFGYLNDTWEYNYFGDTWFQKVDFPGPARAGACSFVIENRCFVGTGFGSGTYYDDFYEYVYPLGTKETMQLNIALFPNPSAGYFYFSFAKILDDPKFRFYSMDGKDVTDHFFAQGVDGSSYEVEVNNLLAGMYYLVIFEKDIVVQSKPVTLVNDN